MSGATMSDTAKLIKDHCGWYTDRHYRLLDGSTGPDVAPRFWLVWLTECDDGRVDVTLECATTREVYGPRPVDPSVELFGLRVDAVVEELRAQQAAHAVEHAAAMRDDPQRWLP